MITKQRYRVLYFFYLMRQQQQQQRDNEPSNVEIDQDLADCRYSSMELSCRVLVLFLFFTETRLALGRARGLLCSKT